MAYKNINTTGELIEFLSKFPSDTRLLHYEDGMEQFGYHEGITLDDELASYKKVKRHTHDAFDGTPYDYEVYEKLYKEECDEAINALSI